MPERTDKTIYIDTNCLWELGERNNRWAGFLQSCKEGKIKVCISEWVVIERGRQIFEQLEKRADSKFSLEPPKSARERHVTLLKRTEHLRSMLLDHKVRILPLQAINREIEEIIADPDTYFSSNNNNDCKDAFIFYDGITNFTTQEIIIYTEERKLTNEFKKKGYEVRNSLSEIIELLPQNVKLDDLGIRDIKELEITVTKNQLALIARYSPDFGEMQNNSEDAHLETMEEAEEIRDFLDNISSKDKDLRLKIMGYAHWYDPITKEQLASILIPETDNVEIIFNNADRLCFTVVP